MPNDATPRFTRKGRETRARIVDVAAKLMFEHGVAGTIIDEVRNTAAVSGSQISHYFHDKRDLTRTVIGARRDDVTRAGCRTQPDEVGLRVRHRPALGPQGSQDTAALGD